MIGLPQVQAFLEVARCGSFAAASQRLGVPRSTVSARIRALEEALKVRLLHRTTRRVALTDEGRRYIDHCEEAIDKLIQAGTELTSDHGLSGTIRITVPVDMPKRPLADMLGTFVDRHPATRIEIVVTDETLDLVAHNLDIALRGGAPGATGLVVRKLGEGEMALFASPRYVAARLPPQPLVNLSEHVIYDPSRRLSRSHGTRALAAAIGTSNFELAKSLAIQSRGIALLPVGVCIEDVKSGSLQRLAHDEQIPPLPLYLVMPSRRHLPARVRAFIDFLTEPATRASIL